MPRPLLTTKLYILPPRPGVIRRPHLLEQLNQGLYRKLTLVSAPAGFGKTTLVSSWLQSCQRPAAWLSLDEGDNDPVTFLSYVVAALKTLTPTLGQRAESLLNEPQSPPAETILTALLNDLAGLAENVILVLDDYHVIRASAVDEALGFFLEHLPPQVHLVMTTREDPQLPLPRLRVRDQLSEVRAADLRFNAEEAAQFLASMDLSLTAHEVARLGSRTEGWIAGLQMAALSLHGRADNAGFIGSFTGSNDFVLDYLAQEVLQQQPDDIQAFLLQTSVLTGLTGPLCDALSGRTDSSDVLETLRRGNLFVIPLDDKREWYRYHHLFADVLRARLAQQRPGELSELHTRASSWYERRALPQDAIRHALAAEDAERAARLLELSWRTMDISFQSATWLNWVKGLPEEVVSARPVLSAGYAWALLNLGHFEAMEAKLQTAEQWLETPENLSKPVEVLLREGIIADEAEFKALPVSLASARAYKAQALGDIAATVQHASRALELLPEDDFLGRGISVSLLGLAYWATGDLDNAFTSLAEGKDMFAKTGNLMAAIAGVFALADMRITQGKLGEAIATYEEALALMVGQDEATLSRAAILHLGLSELYREQGAYELAEQHFIKSETLGKKNTDVMYEYRSLLAKARRLERQGDTEAAVEYLNRAEKTSEQIHIPDFQPAAAFRAQFWLRQGDLNKALAWVQERSLTAKDDLSYLHEFEHITLAKVLLAQYERDKKSCLIKDIMTLLTRLLETAEAGKRTGVVISILLIRALAYQAQRNLFKALVSLEKALTLAGPEGYIQTFVDEGSPMKQLLIEAKARGVKPAYVSKLLAAFEAHKGVKPDPLASATNQSLSEPLTKRELEVLDLLAEGLSNREISKRLIRALDTVKGYNRNIFGKLQVKNRTEAVARARELGLLEP